MTLQRLYKTRNNVDEDGDLVLAILRDHFDAQLQLLLQVKYAVPLDEETILDTQKAVSSLPDIVRQDLAKQLKVNSTDDSAIVDALSKGGMPISKVSEFQETARDAGLIREFGEYADIDFVDRSRFLQELYPGIARLEIQPPSISDVEVFLQDVLDKKSFMQASAPERVPCDTSCVFQEHSSVASSVHRHRARPAASCKPHQAA